MNTTRPPCLGHIAPVRSVRITRWRIGQAHAATEIPEPRVVAKRVPLGFLEKQKTWAPLRVGVLQAAGPRLSLRVCLGVALQQHLQPLGMGSQEQSLESSPSRALASWRSAVSNPSVNQPQIASSLRRAALRSPGRPDVVAVGTQRPDEAWPQRCADLHEMPGDLRIARGAIGTVLTWYDKGVPLVHRKQVEKRDRSVVLVHHTCRRSPRHDVTEDAARHFRFPTRQEDSPHLSRTVIASDMDRFRPVQTEP